MHTRCGDAVQLRIKPCTPPRWRYTGQEKERLEMRKWYFFKP